jgi:hypothetical protein
MLTSRQQSELFGDHRVGYYRTNVWWHLATIDEYFFELKPKKSKKERNVKYPLLEKKKKKILTQTFVL